MGETAPKKRSNITLSEPQIDNRKKVKMSKQGGKQDVKLNNSGVNEKREYKKQIGGGGWKPQTSRVILIQG